MPPVTPSRDLASGSPQHRVRSYQIERLDLLPGGSLKYAIEGQSRRRIKRASPRSLEFGPRRWVGETLIAWKRAGRGPHVARALGVVLGEEGTDAG